MSKDKDKKKKKKKDKGEDEGEPKAKKEKKEKKEKVEAEAETETEEDEEDTADEKKKGKTFNASDIAEKADIDSREIKAFFEVFRRKLEKMKIGSQIRLPGICNFLKVETKPRESRNPRTGEKVQVPAKKKIKVRISGNLKNL